MFLKVKPPDMTDWHNGSRVPQLGLSLHTVLDGLMLCIFTILKVSVSVLYFSDTNLKKKNIYFIHRCRGKVYKFVRTAARVNFAMALNKMLTDILADPSAKEAWAKLFLCLFLLESSK